ncbi:MAG: YlxR family protein [Erysipelothrix sp.]|nr:YlxR family protein [Erysipelothrix sp.]
MKKIPLRKCIATQEQLPKKELLRIVRTPEGSVKIDMTGRMNGRGAYLKKSKEAVELALKRKALERALEVTLDPSFIEELRSLFNES